MSGSIYPNSLDSDSELPRVENNISEIGDVAINAVRSAIFAIESEIGIGASGSSGSVAARLSTSLDNNGNIIPSALLGIGLIALPIDNSQISPTAEILESKLKLNYSTTSLYNLIISLNLAIDVLNGFLTLTGIKVEPHIAGTDYRHKLSHIDIDAGSNIVKINPVDGEVSSGSSVINRNNTNLQTLAKDISDDLVKHQKADSTSGITANTGGTVPPNNYAHNAAGIWINSHNFSSIPQTTTDLQKLSDFIDTSSLLLLGSRTQNLFSSGISRGSRSTTLLSDGYSSNVVPPTPIIAYRLNVPPGPISSSPIDNIGTGDDIILFQPTSNQLSTFNIDAQFSQVQPGDQITVNYGSGISFQFTVESVKTIINGINRTYAVRIINRNPVSSSAGFARIDRPLFNRNKYNVLASSRVKNNTGSYESLVIAHPRGASALGINFNPSEFDSNHYNLYLSLFQNGDLTSIFNLPAIDLTGNQGTTPGEYTLQNIIDTANIAFHSPGFNYRFIAFEFQGQFGIALADPYLGSSFSIVSGAVDTNGAYTSSSLASYPKNVIDNFNGIDPLGLGNSGANLASPPPATSYGSVEAAFFASTLVFSPLKKNFYYVNGIEKDTLNSDPLNIDNNRDAFGDGYWIATILPSPDTQVLANRVEVVYRIELDLSASGLKEGKTIVVQPLISTSNGSYNQLDYGRFTIKTVSYNNCSTPAAFTTITVYDGVHGHGSSPATTSTNIQVGIYFSDDSVSFNSENVFDDSIDGPFKRFFENYINSNGKTFTHERARFKLAGNALSNINIYDVSPKLRGYITNNDLEIRLKIIDYDEDTGIFSGNLNRLLPGPTLTNPGPIITGKKGEIVRFYDETSIDYIDFIFNINDSVGSFTNQSIDIQLFKSLELDNELLLLSTCQVNDSTKETLFLRDRREFGNISEEQLSNSALNFITSIPRNTTQNGIINGFDNPVATVSVSGLFGTPGVVNFNGGSALIDGKIVQMNNSTVSLPPLMEVISPAFITTLLSITWFICVNKNSEIEIIASTDFDPSLSSTYGSLDHNRIFYVQNPNLITPAPYAIRATYLSNLLSNFRDVNILYIATSTISFTSGFYRVVNVNISDARRFITNGY